MGHPELSMDPRSPRTTRRGMMMVCQIVVFHFVSHICYAYVMCVLIFINPTQKPLLRYKSVERQRKQVIQMREVMDLNTQMTKMWRCVMMKTRIKI